MFFIISFFIYIFFIFRKNSNKKKEISDNNIINNKQTIENNTNISDYIKEEVFPKFTEKEIDETLSLLEKLNEVYKYLGVKGIKND